MTYKYNTVNNTAKNNTNLDYTIDLSKYFTTTTSSKKSDYTISILDKIKSIFPWANKNDNKYTILTLDNAPYENYTILDITPEALNLEWNKRLLACLIIFTIQRIPPMILRLEIFQLRSMVIIFK